MCRGSAVWTLCNLYGTFIAARSMFLGSVCQRWTSLLQHKLTSSVVTVHVYYPSGGAFTVGVAATFDTFSCSPDIISVRKLFEFTLT